MFISIVLTCLILRNIQRLFYEEPSCTGNYCLLIAHPDDESMFFSPTLLSLRGRIRIICLSRGDFDGIGDIRSGEMATLCSKYGYELLLFDYEDNTNWDIKKIVDILYVTYLKDPFKTLITFDSRGVSGHKNHISCHFAAKAFSETIHCKVMYLKTTSFISKYIINLRLFEKNYIVSFHQYFVPVMMMLEHRSQLTWFRCLYIAISNYMSYNSYGN